MYHTPLSLFVPATFIHAALRNGRRALWLSIAGAAILLALINGEAASPDLRDAVGGNLTQIALALQDLSS